MPVIGQIKERGYGEKVSRKLPKLQLRVRFPLPAPTIAMLTMTAFLTPLGPQDLRNANIPEPWTYGLQDRVRFGEIDVLGHVNNSVYLRWFENFRISYFRERVLPIIGERQTIVLRNVGLDFMAEIKPDESYILTGRTVELRRTSFTQHYGVWVDGSLRTTGHAVIVTVENGQKAPIAQNLRQALIELDGAAEL